MSETKTIWDQALATFLEEFSPAAELSDSTHQYSTAEIQNMLTEHSGEMITKETICQSMEAMGFKYSNTAGDMLEWLLKKKY